MSFKIRPASDQDREWVGSLLRDRWGSCMIVSRGKVYDASRLPAFVAICENELLGLITYRYDSAQCEIVTLDSLKEGYGIGSALIEAVTRAAVNAGCARLWLVTTNDNTPALRFYQKRGFAIKAVYPNALQNSRRLKPEIPEIGIDGIPIRDEIELEYLFDIKP